MKVGDIIEFVANDEGKMNMIRDRPFTFYLDLADSHVFRFVSTSQENMPIFTAEEIRVVKKSDHLNVNSFYLPRELLPALSLFAIAPSFFHFEPFRFLATSLLGLIFIFPFLLGYLGKPFSQYIHHVKTYWLHYAIMLPICLWEWQWFTNFMVTDYLTFSFLLTNLIFFKSMSQQRGRSLLALLWTTLMFTRIIFDFGIKTVAWHTTQFIGLLVQLAIFSFLLSFAVSKIDDFGAIRATTVRSPRRFLELVAVAFFAALPTWLVMGESLLSWTLKLTIFWIVVLPTVFFNGRQKIINKVIVGKLQ